MKNINTKSTNIFGALNYNDITLTDILQIYNLCSYHLFNILKVNIQLPAVVTNHAPIPAPTPFSMLQSVWTTRVFLFSTTFYDILFFMGPRKMKMSHFLVLETIWNFFDFWSPPPTPCFEWVQRFANFLYPYPYLHVCLLLGLQGWSLKQNGLWRILFSF